MQSASDFSEAKATKKTLEQIAVEVGEMTRTIVTSKSPLETMNAYYDRGRCHDALNESGKAIDDYMRALKLADTPIKRGFIQTMIAMTMLEIGHLRKALYWSIGAVDNNPNDELAFYILGLTCDKCKFYLNAVVALQKAVALKSDYGAARLKLGACLRKSRRLGESVRVLSDYVAENPHDPKGLYELAWSIQLSLDIPDRIGQAMIFYRRSLQAGPSPALRKIIERRIRDLK